MNKFKRLILEVLLWLLIGIIIWLNQGTTDAILTENLIVLIFQAFLIFTVIYFTASNLLFNKKYTLFIVSSVILITVSVIALSYINPLFIDPYQPEFDFNFRPPPNDGKHPPTHVLIQVLILSISYLFATAIEVFIYLKDRERETMEAKNVNLDNELKLLKSQINPHFLFNALNNIYALSAIDANRTQQSITYLSDMLRYVLYECENDFVPIKKEITYIENYLQLFSLKSSKKHPIHKHFNVENNDLKIAPMLFIPFIENALKHGNIEKIKDVFINIKLEAKNNVVNFEIENSKPKTVAQKDSVGGIGIENVKKRLHILYPKKHKLVITETETVFKINLNLEL
ncbi:sensor histidine kinase [Neotamlana laminarinivorans]|uniref:Sensor histidine kinase n=1 Tax=Neotamlana laminarinivorans TaxID=2883124 RepID=A0A9X1HXS0_9FLAO|nr:sensor histidine kinase [Tamlana laminarinivorans]MCB4797731.1 sensor histidine kinase [Tamlana laminarinivorans]